MKKICFILFAILSVQAQAQVNELRYNPRLTGELIHDADKIDGNTFFGKTWISGDIYLVNGEIVRNELIRYNGLLDELLWFESYSGKTICIDRESVYRFHLTDFSGDAGIYFRKIRIKKDILTDSSEIFAEEIYSGHFSLFLSHSWYIFRREVNYKEGVPFEKNIYEEERVYYIQAPDNSMISMNKMNRKGIINAFPAKRDALLKYFRYNSRIDFNNKSESIRFMQFLERI